MLTKINEFITGQKVIHQKLRELACDVQIQGIEPDPNLKNKTGGFFIVLEHPPEIVRVAEDFSRKVSRAAPAIVYNAKAINTSLGSYRSGFGFMANPNKAEHREILEEMSAATRSALQVFEKKSCWIDYVEYLHSSFMAMAVGIPNEGFAELVEEISYACGKRNIPLNPAWGVHITLNRFTARVPAEKLGDFFKLFWNAPPLGKSFPTGVKVGYAMWEPNSDYPDIKPEDLRGYFAAYKRFQL